jgi:hypothetical protein
MNTPTFEKQLTGLLVIDPITISSQKGVFYGR